MMRYEISLYRRLNKFFKVEVLTFEKLLKEDIQNRLNRTWKASYFRVVKLDIQTEPIGLLKQRNGLLLYLAYYGIVDLGFTRIINVISNLNFNVKNPRSKRSKLKKSLKVLFDNANRNSLEKNLVQELDEKILSL